jgi:hypothetical protein
VSKTPCQVSDPELWFVDEHEPGGRIAVALAKQFCNGCFRQESCLDEALAAGDCDYGVRGGLTATERRRILRAYKRGSAA